MILNHKDFEEIDFFKDETEKQKTTFMYLHLANKMQHDIFTQKVEKLALGGKQDDKTISDGINPNEGNKITFGHFIVRGPKNVI